MLCVCVCVCVCVSLSLSLSLYIYIYIYIYLYLLYRILPYAFHFSSLKVRVVNLINSRPQHEITTAVTIKQVTQKNLRKAGKNTQQKALPKTHTHTHTHTLTHKLTHTLTHSLTLTALQTDGTKVQLPGMNNAPRNSVDISDLVRAVVVASEGEILASDFFSPAHAVVLEPFLRLMVSGRKDKQLLTYHALLVSYCRDFCLYVSSLLFLYSPNLLVCRASVTSL